MTVQYNVPVVVLDPNKRYLVQHALKGYKCFTDRSGNLDGTCFSKETVPCVGELYIVKTIKREAAETAHEVLSGIEGLLVLPINQCNMEEDEQRIAELVTR